MLASGWSGATSSQRGHFEPDTAASCCGGGSSGRTGQCLLFPRALACFGFIIVLLLRVAKPCRTMPFRMMHSLRNARLPACLRPSVQLERKPSQEVLQGAVHSCSWAAKRACMR